VSLFVRNLSVDFINIYSKFLCSKIPKCINVTVKLSSFFTLSGYTRSKALSKTLMKLSPKGWETRTFWNPAYLYTYKDKTSNDIIRYVKRRHSSFNSVTCSLIFNWVFKSSNVSNVQQVFLLVDYVTKHFSW